MTQARIAVIVEGHGECKAVPILVRRIAREIDPGFVPVVLPPLRVPASRLIKDGELERSVDFTARKLGGSGGIIVILDCDWGGCCPAKMGPALKERAIAARRDVSLTVILAKMEYEAWFLASAESLRGKRGLNENLQSPSDPESIRGAKGWLSRNMNAGRSYSETDDQPALTEIFDMASARRAADSFDKCYRDINSMLTKLRDEGG